MGTTNLLIILLLYYSCYQFFGGGKRDRTVDLLHAMQALFQLSYTPCFYNEYCSKIIYGL